MPDGTSVTTRTARAAADVLSRAARDGERVVCYARITLAIATLVAWPAWVGVRVLSGEAADVAVIVLSLGSLAFSVGALAWLRGERPERNTTLLRMTSITVDVVLVVGGLLTFVARPPDVYDGITREPGLAFAYVGVVAGGIRLRYAGAIYSAAAFFIGVAAAVVADIRANPEHYVLPFAPSILTAAGLWLTASVFSLLVARRTGEHVKDGATNAADEIEKLHADKHERTERDALDLQTTVGVVLGLLGNPCDGRIPARTWLDRRYRVDTPLGKGGMGRVYLGWDLVEEKRVAIKLMRIRLGSDPEGLVKRFLGEAVAASAIRHKCVVKMEAISTSRFGFFQVQEYVEGVTLEQYLEREGPLSPEMTAELGRHLCSALLAAHARGVIHRDVKPANVMLTTSAPGVKLIDFGVARITEAGAETATGQVIGTRTWMSPEQRRGDLATERSDFYSLALLLATAATGRTPGTPGFSEAIDQIVPTKLQQAIRHSLEESEDQRLTSLTMMEHLQEVARRASGLETLQHPLVVAPSNEPSTLPRFDDVPPRAAPATPAQGAAPDLGSFRVVERSLGMSPEKGEVWLAREPMGNDEADVYVVVRRLPVAVVTPEIASRLVAARTVYHPNLCPSRDVECKGDDFYVPMPLVDGPTLLACHQQWTAQQLRRILADVASAILCIHKHGYTHGSVRAENVRMVGTTPILLDFGAPGTSDDHTGFIALLQEVGLLTKSQPPPSRIEEAVERLQ